MNYHDQKIIRNIVKKLSTMPYCELKKVKKFFLSSKIKAQADVNRINACTSPEESNRRHQSLYYYEDVIEAMEWDK